MKNIYLKTGKRPEDFWKLADKKGFVKHGKIVATRAKMLTWLKSKEVGLGHVHASFIILYLRLRAKDPTVTVKIKEWAYNTGYKNIK